MVAPLYQVPVNRLDGSKASLADYQGSVMLIVNVASACGLTPQYTGLEAVYEKYHDRGFNVLGFPCNDFGAQEPGTADEIKTFCETKYDIKFPMFEKLSVKQDSRHPLYKQLIAAQPKAQVKPGSEFRTRLEGYGIKQADPSDILWNFEKFLINRKGNVIARFSPDIPADDPLIVEAIEAELAKQ